MISVGVIFLFLSLFMSLDVCEFEQLLWWRGCNSKLIQIQDVKMWYITII